MGSILSIGVTGLEAAQIALATAGHNVSNANTPGFTRQQTVQGTNLPQYTGNGFLGQGVNVDTVKRVYSEFLNLQVQKADTQASRLDTYNANISQIDNLLADPAAGLSPILQDFFKAANDVASDPSSVASRQAFLSSSESLTARFNTLNDRFAELRTGVNTQLTNSVEQINTYAKQIAALNGSIMAVQSSALNQAPNDLLDQRDRLVSELNRQVNVTVVKQGDMYNVFAGSGQALVLGDNALALKAVAAPEDPQRTRIAYVTNGNTVLLSDKVFTGGAVAGLLNFRSETLDAGQSALGRVAIGLAQTFNDQHKLGQDLQGNLGGTFFSVGAPNVIQNANNSGSAVIGASIASTSSLTVSDYRLAYDGTNYQLTRVNDNTTSTYASLPQTVDGVTVSLASGTPAAGDSFLIQPTFNGARDIGVLVKDPRAVAAAAPIRSAAAGANAGTGKISAGTVNAPPPTNVNLQQPVTITFTSATTFDVTGTGTGNPTGVAYTPGSTISYNGWAVQISGTPASGDTFSVASNTGGTSDSRNALLLAQLQSKNTLSGGTATYQSAYSQLVSSVGAKAREISVDNTAQQNVLIQTQQSQQALSGVNLDEEAANLMRYQQAYQASGKVIQVASVLFDTILSLGK